MLKRLASLLIVVALLALSVGKVAADVQGNSGPNDMNMSDMSMNAQSVDADADACQPCHGQDQQGCPDTSMNMACSSEQCHCLGSFGSLLSLTSSYKLTPQNLPLVLDSQYLFSSQIYLPMPLLRPPRHA